MKYKNVKPALTEEFNDIYKEKAVEKSARWELLFKDTIKQIENFSSSLHFWYVADFTKGIVKVGGNYELVTPHSKKEWIGMKPWDMGKLFHPLDKAKMQSFIVYIASYLALKKEQDRKKIKISFVFRMQNAHQQYTWRTMEYPAMHYFKNEPRYLLGHVKDIQHLVTEPKCVMYILDSTEKEATMYFCDEEKVQLRPLYPAKALSGREIEITKLLVKGLISKEIAEVLNISKNTVENHKQNIYGKTGTKKINELITYANRYLINSNEP